MYYLSKIILFFFSIVALTACEDSLAPNDSGYSSLQCAGENSNVVDGKCTCLKDTYWAHFMADDNWCRPLSDSFYIRKGHKGDITNFEIMNTLKLPSDRPMFEFENGISEKFPTQFIVELVPHNIKEVFPEGYLKPYISLVVTNVDPENEDFPIVGKKDFGKPPAYQGPKNLSDLDYGVRYEWQVNFRQDSALLEIDVYSLKDDSLFLDDEITMYFERYRE